MTSAIITNSITEAKVARSKLDAALGYPSVGINAATGIPNMAGWTITTCDIIEAYDWPTVGTTQCILVVRPEDSAVASSAGYAIVDVDFSTVVKGARYTLNSVQSFSYSPTLDETKQAKFAQIDAKTDAIIASGYEWPAGSGIKLSASLESQIRCLGLLLACMGSTPPTFPIPWNSLDDTQKAVITSIADAQSMFAAGVVFIETAVLGGTTFKEQVRAAQTIAEVDAIIDTR